MSSNLRTPFQTTLSLASMQSYAEAVGLLGNRDVIALPPLSDDQFLSKLSTSESILFGGATYVLLPHQAGEIRDGWTVNAIYPNGSKKTFGEGHGLTRPLAVQVAKEDAMDWWMNRRETQVQVTLG